MWEDSFCPDHSEPEAELIYNQLQNRAVNPSNRQGIDKGERVGEAEMDDEAGKQRSLLRYTHTQMAHTHLHKFTFRESCKQHTDTHTKPILKQLLQVLERQSVENMHSQ